jgi:hypothetical protein
VIGYVGTLNNLPTVGSGYTIIDQQTSTFGTPEYQIQTTATAVNTPFVNGADEWTDQQAVFY